jgi:hypothetical protein
LAWGRPLMVRARSAPLIKTRWRPNVNAFEGRWSCGVAGLVLGTSCGEVNAVFLSPEGCAEDGETRTAGLTMRWARVCDILYESRSSAIVKKRCVSTASSHG